MSRVAETRPAAPRTRAMKALHVASGTALTVTMAAAFGVVAGSLWRVASGPAAPTAGQPAPAFRAERLSGGWLALSDLRGQVVLLDFWATWCPPCVASIPHLQHLHETYSGDGLAVVGVNQEPNAREPVRQFLRRRGLSFPNVADAGRGVARRYGVYTYPTTVLVDRHGRIARRYRGTVSAARLERDVRDLLAEPGPTAAAGVGPDEQARGVGSADFAP